MAGLNQEEKISAEEALPTLSNEPKQWRLKTLLVKASFAKIGGFALEPPFKVVDRKAYYEGTHDAQEAKNIIKELKVIGFETSYITTEDGVGRITFANNMSDLETYNSHTDADAQEMGRLYGFPETAIKAYPDQLIKPKDLPQAIQENPLFDLIPFLMSKSNFQEEWDGYVAEVKAAKEKLPDLARDLKLQNI